MNKISKHKNELQISDTEQGNSLFSNVVKIIERRKFNAIGNKKNVSLRTICGLKKS